MKKLSKIIASVVLVFGMSNVVIAQDYSDTHEASHAVEISIPTIALVDVEGAGGEIESISLAPTFTGMEAGEAADFSTATNSSLWLNYTSIVAADQTRNITAQLNSDLPAGLNLRLEASSASNTGNGTKGSTVGQVILSSTAAELITGIGSAYTGNGENNGHQLTYSLDADEDSYSTLVSNSYDLTVTFTITGE